MRKVLLNIFILGCGFMYFWHIYTCMVDMPHYRGGIEDDKFYYHAFMIVTYNTGVFMGFTFHNYYFNEIKPTSWLDLFFYVHHIKWFCRYFKLKLRRTKNKYRIRSNTRLSVLKKNFIKRFFKK